ncbi:hypothetical protein RHSIM_RhsimUnG0209100 [Rhododendron simsii]|uniref:Possible tRNA binding domain-containing protein n=1 Tax=Rhododendron simsii TaxID=118357 RepID=A0A834L256_RHOSS|nr:hypothetical protein RHSIM_RhsimUnG0209100 [Rhododendron simsii]
MTALNGYITLVSVLSTKTTLRFSGRFGGLLDSSFRAVEYKLAMSVLDPKINFTDLEPALPTISDRFLKSLDGILTPFDMKQLEA